MTDLFEIHHSIKTDGKAPGSRGLFYHGGVELTRKTHTDRDGLLLLPQAWVGGQALGQMCGLFHISWALNSAHGQSGCQLILASG